MRPKNCCSKGAELEIVETTICKMHKMLNTSNNLILFSFIISGKVKIIFGSRYKAHDNIRLNLGTTIESLLNQGEITIVIKNEFTKITL